MLVFRSEDHLEAWLERGHPKGERMSVEQQWALAQAWFEGRHLPGWRKRTPAQAEEVFRSVGLGSDFWTLT